GRQSRKLGRRLPAGLGAATLALGIAVGLLTWSPIHPHATDITSDTVGFPTLFRDNNSQMVLSVRLGVDQGSFDFSVPGVGHSRGRVPLSPSAPNFLHLQGDVAATFSATAEILWTPHTLRLAGSLQPATAYDNPT